ncbi:MAG: hypothetical protein WC365_10010 [Candidatus Babeliales bacterium]|jgi:hypothetical protein
MDNDKTLRELLLERFPYITPVQLQGTIDCAEKFLKQFILDNSGDYVIERIAKRLGA